MYLRVQPPHTPPGLSKRCQSFAHPLSGESAFMCKVVEVNRAKIQAWTSKTTPEDCMNSHASTADFKAGGKDVRLGLPKQWQYRVTSFTEHIPSEDSGTLFPRMMMDMCLGTAKLHDAGACCRLRVRESQQQVARKHGISM
eukprot:3884053-Amphidinium_carterae.1